MTAQPVETAAEPIETAAEPMKSGPTGPRTEEGKARTRLNAFRHGLTGQIFVCSPEETDVYRSHCSGILDHYQPAGPIEIFLTDQVANGMWRLQRSAAIEQGIIAIDDAGRDETELGPAFAWLQQQKAFRLLITYEARIRRALERDKAELEALQKARKDQAARDMNQAVALHNLAKAEGKPYNPGQYFRMPPPVRESVFSIEIVAAEATRRDALQAALAAVARLNRKAA